MKRITFATLSSKNLENNFYIVKNFAKQSSVIAMVKANAYGHGIRAVSLKLNEFGADGFGVARIDEALILREIGIKKPIIVMDGIFSQEELMIASIQNLEIVFHSNYQIDLLEKNSFLPKKIKAWFKIDSGMSRLGFLVDTDENFEKTFLELKRISKNKNIDEKIVLISHFSTSGDKLGNSNILEKNMFEKFYNFVISNAKTFFEDQNFLVSLCNSGAIFNFPEYQNDIVRPGISLYGYSSINHETSLRLGLRPVMTLCAEILSIKILQKNSFIGYNCTYQCKEKTKIGIISIGYGDGYPLINSNKSFVLISGIKCKIIGRVSMDMLAINLNDCDDAKIGDIVILFGGNFDENQKNGGNEFLSIDEIVSKNSCDGLSVYNMLTAVQSRVKFYWHD